MTAALSLSLHIYLFLLLTTSSSRVCCSEALSFTPSSFLLSLSSAAAVTAVTATRGRTTTNKVNRSIFFTDRRALTSSTSISSALFSSISQQHTSSPHPKDGNHTYRKRHHHRLPLLLQGDWDNAKSKLRDPDCCVVTISNMEEHISILQQYFCGENNAHSDLDLRMRVRGCRSLDEVGAVNEGMVYRDCETIYNSVMADDISPSSLLSMSDEISTKRDGNNYDEDVHNYSDRHRCIMALAELARGMASLTDGTRLTRTVTDVHVRVVRASNYAASDPMFHTDKCPLRGYVTLTGPGTEYMQETCLPWEYAALRSSGAVGLNGISGNNKATRSLKMANELEFIVMKGDEYESPDYLSSSSSIVTLSQRLLWNRSSACVHRSPPGSGKRRVILSLDLADGKDNQEWYEVGRRREWRSGMTQRKSRLVS